MGGWTLACDLVRAIEPRRDPSGTAMLDCLQNGQGWCQVWGVCLGRQSYGSPISYPDRWVCLVAPGTARLGSPELPPDGGGR